MLSNFIYLQKLTDVFVHGRGNLSDADPPLPWEYRDPKYNLKHDMRANYFEEKSVVCSDSNLVEVFFIYFFFSFYLFANRTLADPFAKKNASYDLRNDTEKFG